MADLGDLTKFLKEGSVVDLDWLDVDEKQYRELDTLPKQNLDIAPDLEHIWSHTDMPQTIVPNKDRPQTMGDLSQAHGKLATDEVTQKVIRVARLALMQSTDLEKFRHALVTRFDSTVLAAARSVLATVLGERGLLGCYYVDAFDFPVCNKAGKEVTSFVKRYSSSSQFVLAKQDCAGCIHSSGNTCAVFQKKLVLEVPYTLALAEAVERSQSAQGKSIQASTQAPRERIKAAFLSGAVRVVDRVESPKPILNPAQYMRATLDTPKVHLPVMATQYQAFQQAQMAWQPVTVVGKTAGTTRNAADKKAFDIMAFLRREMLKAHGEQALLHALRLSFSLDDLRATRQAWEPIFKEAGYYGTVYATQESFDDCHEGADFLAKFNPQIKGIVAGGKCAGCIYNKMSRCMMYGKSLVAKAEDLYTQETVNLVLREHRLAGRIASGMDTAVWGNTPAEALKAVYRSATKASQAPAIPMRAYVEQAFRGQDHGHITAGLTKRQIVSAATRYINEGLYGEDLRRVLASRFDPRDLVASEGELKVALAEQGLQGIFYVDPTVYDDYAKGCDEGARIHRARMVPYLKIGPKCASCVLQHHRGFCSKYAKELVIEPPYSDKAAQQKEILASGKSTEINLGTLMNNSKSIVAEFALKSATDIDLNPELPKSETITVELGGAKIDL